MHVKNFVVIQLSIIFGITSALAASPDHKSFNVSISPVGFVLGVANLDVDLGFSDAISKYVTLGPAVQYAGFSSNSTPGYTFSIGATSSFFIGHPRFTTGFFAKAHLEYAFAALLDFNSVGFGVGAKAGWAWYWDSGFNLGLGLGAAYISAASNFPGYPSLGLFPDLVLQLGYAF